MNAFEAQLIILEHKNIICAGYNAILHVHSCVEEVSIGVRFNRGGRGACLGNLLTHTE